MKDIGSQDGNTPVQELSSSTGDVMLPEGVDLSDVSFSRDGADLMIETGSGAMYFVSDYYTADYPGDVIAADGSMKHGTELQELADSSEPSDIQLAQVEIQGLDLGSPAGDSSPLTDEPIGTVENVEGIVNVTRADGTQATLNVGDSVYQGDVIETPDGSGVGITLADTSNFSLGENSEMVLDELIYDPGSQEGSAILSLVEGTASYVSGQIAKINPNAVSIETPVATIGIRGTKVFVEYQDGKFNAINLMETTLEGEQPGEIVVFDMNGTPLGTTNQANIGWSFDSSRDSSPVQTTYSLQDVETLTGSTTSFLPASLAEEARNAMDIEEALKEAAAIAEEEAAEAKAKAEAAEKNAEQLEQEALAAEEKALTLLSEAEQAELAAEAARALLEQLMAEGAAQSAILQAQARLNQLVSAYQNLIDTAQVAQTAASTAYEEAQSAKYLLSQANREYEEANEAAEVTLNAAREASENASEAYSRATSYVGYEANYKFNEREDRNQNEQFAANAQNTPAQNTNAPQKGDEGDDRNKGSSYDDILVSETPSEDTTEDVISIVKDINTTTTSSQDSEILTGSNTAQGTDNTQDDDETPVVLASNTEGTTTSVTQTLSGKGVDGYLSNARVFIDQDGDGVWDAGEDYTFTDSRGNFSLSTAQTTGDLTISGGTDIATGKAFYGVLTAPSGSTIVSPLTTLLDSMVDSGQTLAEAKSKLAAAFGLDASIDLTSTDPIAGAAQGSAALSKIAAVGVQIQNTIMQAGRAMEGASSSLSSDDAADAMFDSIASAIVANGNNAYDIADSTNLQNAINSAASNILTGAELTTAQNAASSTASIISSSNTVINSYIEAGGTGSNFLSSIAQVQVVADDASNELKTAIDTGGDLNTLQTNYSASNLTTKIESASIQDVTGDGNTNTVNNAPTVGNAISLNGTEDTALTITTAQLIANSSDANGDTLSITNLTASSGTLVNNNDGTWTLTPAANSTDDITLTFNVSDGVKSTASTGTVSLSGVNDAPTVSSAVTLDALNEDTQVTVSQAQLLANASDVEGDDLSVSNVTATGGSIVDNENGTWTITPDANSTSEVTLSYTISDSNNATVSQTATIDLLAVNDAPTVSRTAVALSGTEDTAITITPAQLLTDYASDVDGDTLSVQNLSTNDGGTLVANDNGTWTYTPAENATSNVSFTFDVSDGTTTTQGAATLSLAAVNDAPTVSGPVTLDALNEDTSVTLNKAQLLANASDVDGDTLDVTNVSATGGTVVDNGNETWAVTPDANATGEVTLSYTVSDTSGASVSHSATIDLNPVNDAPVLSYVSLDSATEDQTYTINVSDLIASSVASDVDGDTLSVSNVTVSHGSVSETSDGVWTVTPQANYNGNVTVTYTVSDGTTTTSNTTNLVYKSVNDAPTVSNTPVTLSGTEDTTFVVRASDLLANDYASDVDGDTLSVLNLSTNDGGNLVYNNDNTWNYTPASNSTSDVSFTFDVSDGTTTTQGAATLSLTAVNDAPVTSGDVVFSGTAGEQMTFTSAQLLSLASDVDNQNLSVSNVSVGETLLQVDNDGNWVYTPQASGTLNLSYTISDGENTINANAVANVAEAQAQNTAPTAGDAVSLSGTEDTVLTITKAQLLANASDANEDTLYIQSLSTNDGGTLVYNNDDTWSYTPVADSTSDVTFTYTISDGTDTVNTTATLSLAAVNDAPVVTDTVSLSGTEDTALTITTAQLISETTDVENDALSVSNLQASAGTLVDNNDGTWTLTPVADSTADVTFSYSVSDGENTVNAGATASFASVNDAPVVSGNVSLSGAEDTTLTITKAQLLANASDVDNDSLLVQNLATDDGGTLVYNGDDTWNYTPVANSTANVTFSYNVYDGTTTTAAQAVASFSSDGTTEGTSGNDTMVGTDGADTITALFGDDTITGGAGNDTIDGGEGTDVAVFSGNSSDYTFGENADGLLTVTDNNTADGDDGTDTLVSVETFQFADQLLNEIPDDEADDANDTDDWLVGGNGVDNINAGGGNDWIFTFNGGDSVDGGSGDDLIWGGNGNDTLDGGSGSDRIYGDNGNDLIIMDSGDAVVSGGNGTDTIRLENGDSLNFITSSINFSSIEIIDLATDTLANALTFTAQNVDDISSNNSFTIDGDGSDTVNLSGNWTQGNTDGNGYTTYSDDDSNISVQITSTVQVTGV